MRMVMVVAILGVLGCGGGLDPAMAGTWSGPATYSFTGLSSLSQGAIVRTTVAGDTGRVIVNGQGAGDGCGQSRALSVHFVGTR